MRLSTRGSQMAALVLGAVSVSTAAAAGFGYVWWLGPMAFELLGPRATAFSATLFARQTPLMIGTAVLIAVALAVAQRRDVDAPVWIRTAVRTILLVAAGIGATAATARWWFPWIMGLLRT